MLIRSLTDAFLVALDEFAGVSLIATTNNVLIDPAALRRFAFTIEVGDRLSPEQERLAWSSLLGCEPPFGWRPAGAAVADYVLAWQRCRMLGQSDAKSLQTSVEAARRARLGLPATASQRSEPMLAKITRH